MDLTTEKAELIKQIQRVNDLSLVIAVKHLLDYGTNKKIHENDVLLETSIQTGLEQAKKNMFTSHNEVFSQIRVRYAK